MYTKYVRYPNVGNVSSHHSIIAQLPQNIIIAILESGTINAESSCTICAGWKERIARLAHLAMASRYFGSLKLERKFAPFVINKIILILLVAENMKMIAEIYIYIYFYKSLQVSYVLIDLLSVDVRKNCQCVLKIIQISNIVQQRVQRVSFLPIIIVHSQLAYRYVPSLAFVYSHRKKPLLIKLH